MPVSAPPEVSVEAAAKMGAASIVAQVAHTPSATPHIPLAAAHVGSPKVSTSTAAQTSLLTSPTPDHPPTGSSPAPSPIIPTHAQIQEPGRESVIPNAAMTLLEGLIGARRPGVDKNYDHDVKLVVAFLRRARSCSKAQSQANRFPLSMLNGSFEGDMAWLMRGAEICAAADKKVKATILPFSMSILRCLFLLQC